MMEYKMGSKSPPVRKTSHGERGENEAFEHRVSQRPPAGRHLVTRIAEALQLPEQVLYAPAHKVTPYQASESKAAINPAVECDALLSAYNRIQDPEERRRVLLLVQEAADQA
ncbi:hypothetical protein ACQKQD_26910 [Methylobacterium sp. NPDC080182]|uniref:hypothetical protein n=1 Tax=Methylobacterium sp. NPDC080182 TaxID=3390590 RepID=UPI003D00EDCA